MSILYVTRPLQAGFGSSGNLQVMPEVCLYKFCVKPRMQGNHTSLSKEYSTELILHGQGSVDESSIVFGWASDEQAEKPVLAFEAKS